MYEYCIYYDINTFLGPIQQHALSDVQAYFQQHTVLEKKTVYDSIRRDGHFLRKCLKIKFS